MKKAMMKQPADNTNATPQEERQSARRVTPAYDPTEEYAEIEAEVRRMASTTGSEGTPATEDWNRAAEFVRNRRTSRSKA
jgi:hypothetical protein